MLPFIPWALVVGWLTFWGGSALHWRVVLPSICGYLAQARCTVSGAHLTVNSVDQVVTQAKDRLLACGGSPKTRLADSEADLAVLDREIDAIKRRLQALPPSRSEFKMNTAIAALPL